MHADAIGLALNIVDEARDCLDRCALRADGRASAAIGGEGVKRRSVDGRMLIARIAELDLERLPDEIRIALEVVRERAEILAVQEAWYWTVFDPGASGLFGMFAPTPYAGGLALASLSGELARVMLTDEGARFRYLAMLSDFAQLIEQFADRTQGQAERGIRMPRAQAEAAQLLIERMRGLHIDALQVGDERLAGQDPFKREVARLLDARVGAAFDAMAAVVDDAYLARTRDEVGLAQYPDGEEIYRDLVRMHGSTDMSPAEVHALGLERIAQIRLDMVVARAEAGFDGDDHGYRAALDADSAWRAGTPEQVAALFQRYIDRFEPHIDALFPVRPETAYGVAPLPEALSAATTFGYYRPGKPEGPRADYVFNAVNLAQSGLFNIGALTYHELVPGHHLHLATQAENKATPWIRRTYLPTAFTEGWAEYAATLAGETGMYRTPAERFGRLVSEAFLACRLVVDTGMNALGWSLDKARQYMRENSFMPEAEIRSETLRYGCDIPGQALAYKLGDRALMAMRAKMATTLGPDFDLRAFHGAVLRAGALPLPVLDRHLERETARRVDGGRDLRP